ncbi:MAG: aminoacetone oxidase family FAD-binding enzyme [Clostridia bacterium]|nr:aminoacetone oxidase family FAD-binding enzyme [Clostridia bacterium]
MSFDVIIVGGGAAGLMAAAQFARTPLQILVIERNPRVGKKILSTGNGRCNLSNRQMEPELYYEAAGFVQKLYKAVPPDMVLSRFKSLGLMTTDEEDRIYPRSMAAASVLDVLRNAIDSQNITVLTDTLVTDIRKSKSCGWSVQLESGKHFSSRFLILAAGGSAAPKLGSDGNGPAMFKKLSLPVTPASPSLVQLRCAHRALPSLKGLRVSARLTLSISGEKTRSETGELLFADYGVSGICTFQLSRFVPPAIDAGRKVWLLIHFLPEIEPEDVSEWLAERIARAGTNPIQSVFTGVFQRILTLAILREAEIGPDLPAAFLSDAQTAALIQAVTAFSLPVTGTQGFEHAQVSRGGLCRDVINPETMEVLPDLYAAGEIIDCDGPCGGYNLHFAFASGMAAANAILEKYKFETKV